MDFVFSIENKQTKKLKERSFTRISIEMFSSDFFVDQFNLLSI